VRGGKTKQKKKRIHTEPELDNFKNSNRIMGRAPSLDIALAQVAKSSVCFASRGNVLVLAAEKFRLVSFQHFSGVRDDL
jgi:regulator of RNase E activity RraA